MIAHDLHNGYTNLKLVEWQTFAWAHSVVDGTSTGVCNRNVAPDGFSVILTKSETWMQSGKASTEFLSVTFQSGDDTLEAMMLTELDLVVLYSVSDCEYEILGEMTHSGFWAHLNEYPNYFKHMSKCYLSQGQYWLNK